MSRVTVVRIKATPNYLEKWHPNVIAQLPEYQCACAANLSRRFCSSRLPGRFEICHDVGGLIDVNTRPWHRRPWHRPGGIVDERADQVTCPDVAAGFEGGRVTESRNGGDAASNDAIERGADADFSSEAVASCARGLEISSAAFQGRPRHYVKRLIRRGVRQ
jgi:hypothetical protein